MVTVERWNTVLSPRTVSSTAEQALVSFHISVVVQCLANRPNSFYQHPERKKAIVVQCFAKCLVKCLPFSEYACFTALRARERTFRVLILQRSSIKGEYQFKPTPISFTSCMNLYACCDTSVLSPSVPAPVRQ